MASKAYASSRHHSVCIAEPSVATVYRECHTGWPARLMPVVSIIQFVLLNLLLPFDGQCVCLTGWPARLMPVVSIIQFVLLNPLSPLCIVCLSHWIAGKAHFSSQHHSVCIAEPFVATGWPVCVSHWMAGKAHANSFIQFVLLNLLLPLDGQCVCHTGWPARLMPIATFSLYC